MSDILETNQSHSADVENDAVDTLDSRPLFQEDDDEEELAAPPRRRGLWWIVGSIILVLLIVGASFFYYTQHTKTSSVQYQTYTVTTGNLTTQVSASGPLQAQTEYDENFTAPGKVQTINVKVGQSVNSGTILATLSAPNLETAVQQAQITVNNDQEIYNTAVSYGDAQTTLDADNNTLQIAKLQLQTAQNNLAATTMTSPGSGTVVSISGVVGQNVSGTTSSTATPFITILNTSSYTIAATVNETDIANVQLNQQAQFTVSAFPSKTFQATVTNISPISTTTSGVVSYPVTLNVTMSSIGQSHLYPGMTATVNITTAQRIGATLVNNTAFTFPTTALQAGVINRSDLTQLGGGRKARQNSGSTSTSSSTTGSRHIVLVLRNGKLVPVAITVGLTNGTVSEVLSGLSSGDQVVVGATGGPFANISTSSSTTTTRTGRNGLGGLGTGRGTGATRTGSGG